MHIAINAHLLAHTRTFRRAGVSNHIEGLLHALGRIDTHNRYTIFTTRGMTGAALGLPDTFQVRSSWLPTINPRVRVPWEQFVLPVVLQRLGVDVYHGVLNVMPLAGSVPAVVTIHDLSPFFFPQTFRRVNRTYTRWAVRVAARRARVLFAVSEFTQREIIRWFEVPAERVMVTPNAADARFVPPTAAELAAFRERHQLPERFLLFLGTLEPRKNLPRLIEAYQRVADEIDVPLLIGGGRGWLYDSILAQAAPLGERVRFVGYIPQDEQHLWYAAATAFVFPSLYEGFGMPPLEAMACGTPVITSTSSSLPEVVGDAGLLVPPEDVTALAAALRRIVDDQALRDRLRDRGLQRARHFSWDAAAHVALAGYARATRQPAGA
jgi:glycosyltransferase involved in cell wall biosynthesis